MFGKNEDYVNIGSNGFAQLGEDDYREKALVEMEVLLLALASIKPPEEWKEHIRLGVKSFRHDFGTYKEVVVYYPRDEVDDCDPENVAQELEDCLISKEAADLLELKGERFWSYVHKLEAFDLESDELTSSIEQAYARKYGHHLKVVPKEQSSDDAKAVG